jgi:hypothetical protein
MTEKRNIVKLDKEPGHHGPNAVIEVVAGPRPYLWIGDDEDGGKCYATLSGKELRKLTRFTSEEAR